MKLRVEKVFIIKFFIVIIIGITIGSRYTTFKNKVSINNDDYIIKTDFENDILNFGEVIINQYGYSPEYMIENSSDQCFFALRLNLEDEDYKGVPTELITGEINKIDMEHKDIDTMLKYINNEYDFNEIEYFYKPINDIEELYYIRIGDGGTEVYYLFFESSTYVIKSSRPLDIANTLISDYREYTTYLTTEENYRVRVKEYRNGEKIINRYEYEVEDAAKQLVYKAELISSYLKNDMFELKDGTENILIKINDYQFLGNAEFVDINLDGYTDVLVLVYDDNKKYYEIYLRNNEKKTFELVKTYIQLQEGFQFKYNSIINYNNQDDKNWNEFQELKWSGSKLQVVN